MFSHTYFLNDDLREELQKRSEIIRTAPGPGLNLPDELQGYHTLVPLESIGGDRRKFGNWYSTVYRATSEATGIAHALRRIESEFLLMVSMRRVHDLSRRLSSDASSCFHGHRVVEPHTTAEHRLSPRSIHHSGFQ
jgi:hypothetical protein